MSELTSKSIAGIRRGITLRSALIGAGLVGVGMMLGSTVNRPSDAWGEILSSAPPQSFKSGSQISVPVLEDIAATLHQIDGRLSRLEVIAKQMRTRDAAAARQ